MSNAAIKESDSSQLLVEVISDYGSFVELQHSWQRLYRQDPEAQLFLSWQWFNQIFSTNSSNWRILAIRSDGKSGQYVAFLPLRTEPRLNKDRNAFCDEISMAGSFFWADYTGFLCDPDYETSAIPLLATALKSMDWNRLFLKHLRCSEHRRELFLTEFSQAVFSIEKRRHTINDDDIDKLICPWVPLEASFDEYLNTRVSSNSRQKIRRFLRKADEQKDFRISITSEDTLDRDLEIFAEYWRQKWRSEKGRYTDRLVEKYQRILRAAFHADLLFMPILWKKNRPLGVLCHFVDTEKKQLLFFVAGRESSSNNPPTGLLLHAFSIRWAIEQNLQRYDFLRGNEAYKYSFGCEEEHIEFIVIATRSGRNLNGRLDPGGINTVQRLCEYHEKRGRVEIARLGYAQILEQVPDHSKAARQLTKLSSRPSSRNPSRDPGAITDELNDARRHAESDQTVPLISVSDTERQTGILASEKVELANELFAKYGVLQLNNVWNPADIQSCNKQFLNDYENYFGSSRPDDCLAIGDQRFQITIELKNHFNNPLIYANPVILALMHKLLGKRHVLGCTVCATSLPGSDDQHLHKDHRALFTRDADDPPIPTPPFAITTMVPLVALDESIGTTMVKKGSHLLSRRDSKQLPTQRPIVSVGSCFLMDLRLSHQGMGNQTQTIRPILNMVYQQRWFADNKNFSKQAPLRVSDDEFAKIPEDLTYLFEWARQPGPDIQRRDAL